MSSGFSKWKKGKIRFDDLNRSSSTSRKNTQMTKIGCDYTDCCVGDDRSLGMIDFPLTNVNCDSSQLNSGGKKFRKKKGIAGKTLSLISKKTPLHYINHEDDVGSKLKRVCSQTKKFIHFYSTL